MDVDWGKMKADMASLLESGDWHGAYAMAKGALGVDAGNCMLAALDAAGRYGSEKAGGDIARMAAFGAGYGLDGWKVREGALGALLGPVYAFAVGDALAGAQGANLAFLGDHGWVPGEGTGASVMADMASSMREDLKSAGLLPYVPGNIPDGFADALGPAYGAGDGMTPTVRVFLDLRGPVPKDGMARVLDDCGRWAVCLARRGYGAETDWSRYFRDCFKHYVGDDVSESVRDWAFGLAGRVIKKS